MNSSWFSGKGYEIDFDDILLEIEKHIANDGGVFIGTDSMPRIDMCTFATAICLHGARDQSGGRYFYKRSIERNEGFSSLRYRIMCEVQRSIDIGIKIMSLNPDASVEIHIDIGSTAKSKTRGLKEALGGWALGAGFEYKIKPHAWASASVADKHTK